MANTNDGVDSDLVCKPLNSYEELISFLENPPIWGTMCEDMRPHSKQMIKNIEINRDKSDTDLLQPETFCHFEPDTEKDVPRYDQKKMQKTLVCHDMANGYHDDSVVNGTKCHDAYNFYNWSGIDIFCYFSHHLITIPPLGWINVGHAHGVKVIGTIITEWDDGQKFWENLLEFEADYRSFASALVSVAKLFMFDGWLLNIENSIKEPHKLLDFVRYFHRILHQELKDPVLIWYDSVTIQGILSWQNGLNHLNRAFFTACDGIFTNYSWTEGHIISSAREAGDRVTDVYIGIDVWGRNFYGGGQFNTEAAVKLAHKHGCSLAIFAPAWSHEGMTQEDCSPDTVVMADGLDSYRQFLIRDRALWGSIWQYLNTRLPCHLPFSTSFCRGQGLQKRVNGEVVSSSPWYNLRHMQYQPNSAHGPHGYIIFPLSHNQQINKDSLEHSATSFKRFLLRQNLTDDESNEGENELTLEFEALCATNTILASLVPSPNRFNVKRNAVACVPGDLECLELYLDDSFNGGSCLKINPSDKNSVSHRFTRLFHCDFPCTEKIIACVVSKPYCGYPEQSLFVHLCMKDQDGRDFKVVLIGFEAPEHRDLSNKFKLYPVAYGSNKFRELENYVIKNEPSFHVRVENAYNWSVRYYVISMPGSRITSINLRTSFSEGPILLGHFGLCEMKSESKESKAN